MKMGNYIKHLRESKDLSQEQLGELLDPPVQKAAVAKWEKGRVENLKRTHILQLAKIFNVKPSDLMCFDEKLLSEEVKTIELVQKYFGKDVVQLLQDFQQLNEIGKEKALEMLSDLTELPKYRVQDGST